MAEQKTADTEEVEGLSIPTRTKDWIRVITVERQKALQPLLWQGFKLKRFPDVTKEPEQTQYRRFQVLLEKLDEHLQMTPEIREGTKIDVCLEKVMDEDKHHFPEADIATATRLMTRWIDEKWGANEVKEEDSDEQDGFNDDDAADSGTGEEPAPKRRRTSSTTVGAGSREILLPPREHPIFGMKREGRRGVMYGVALKQGQRRSYALNPALARFKRSGNAYGSNGLHVGAWFPYQLLALFNGAHSTAQGGISGNTENGAYSIVVSGHYDDLDRDEGDTIYYSGSNSHDNTDPQSPAPSSQGTTALQSSHRTQRPVRVLRAASGKSIFAPTVGLRYDGLYRVVAINFPRNQKGGMYEQFKLVRLEDQDAIDDRRPSPEERRDFEKIGRGYA